MPPRPEIRWLPLFGVWTALGVLLTFQTFSVVELPADPVMRRQAIQQVLFMQISRAWLWALLTPLVWAAARRIRLDGWRLPAGLALHAALCATLTLWVLWFRTALGAVVFSDPEWWLPNFGLDATLTQISSRQLIDLSLYIGLVGAGRLFDLQAEKRRSEQESAALRERLISGEAAAGKLRAELVDAQMRALKERLHPHFLFNALNAVSGLVRRQDTGRAVEALTQMSHLLRALLGNSERKFLPLEQELDYCRIYLDIEKLRFDERLQVEIAADPLVLKTPVPALLLQPLAENAVKHGIARRRAPGRIFIEARLRGERLLLAVENDPAEQLAGTPAPVGHGIGLSTIRNRLQIAYRDRFRLDFHHAPPAPTRVEIELPASDPAREPSLPTHESHPHAHR
jgi:sensor histidine kinase YesM